MHEVLGRQLADACAASAEHARTIQAECPWLAANGAATELQTAAGDIAAEGQRPLPLAADLRSELKIVAQPP